MNNKYLREQKKKRLQKNIVKNKQKEKKKKWWQKYTKKKEDAVTPPGDAADEGTATPPGDAADGGTATASGDAADGGTVTKQEQDTEKNRSERVDSVNEKQTGRYNNIFKNKEMPEWMKWIYKKLEWKKIGITLLVLLAGSLFVGFVLFFSQYNSYRVIWSAEEETADLSVFSEFGEGGMIQASRDRAVYYNESGEVIWTISYKMTIPQIVRREGYALIYDKQGRTFLTCNELGQTGSGQTSMSITKGDVSAGGIAVFVLESENTSYISYFDKEGAKLDIDIRMPMGSYGYPYDISISPDGQQLMTSVYYISEGMGKSKVIFFDFETGQDVPDRTIGAFEDYYETNTLIPDVYYFSKGYAAAIGDNRISYFLTKTNKDQIQRIKDITIDGEIQSVFYNETYLGVITQKDNQKWLAVYTPDGKEKAYRALEADYSHAAFAHDYITLYRENGCRVETFSGRVKFDGSFDGTIHRIVPSSSDRKYNVVLTNKLEQVLLK